MSMESSDDLDRRLAAAFERVGQGARTLLRAASLAEGLSPTQGQLLLRLVKAGLDVAEPARLAARLDVSRPTVTDALGSLESKGLVRRAKHPEDGRRRVFAPTSRGREVAERLDRWDDPLIRAVDGIPRERRAAALRATLDVIATLVDDEVVTVGRTCTSCRFFRADVHLAPAAHHCTLLDSALADDALQVDCPDHERPIEAHSQAWPH